MEKLEISLLLVEDDKVIRNIYAKILKQHISKIYIANDGSEDRTGEIIEEYARKHKNIKHVQTVIDKVAGLTAKKNALNQGIQQSRGEIILSTDADCYVKNTWIETMVSYFADDVGMVVGFSQFGQPQKKYTVFQQLQALDFLSLMGAAQGSVNLRCPLAASGQNLGYRRKAFEEIGGFQRVKFRISGDDVLILQLIHKLTKWKVRFAPSEKAYNWTRPEKTFKSFLNQRKRWASNGSYQLRLNKIFFFFISIMFLMNALIFIGSPIYILYYGTAKIPLFCLLAKFLIEFLITIKAARIYKRTDLLKYFPIWVLLQIPYVVFTGFFGTFGQFKWKDRHHYQELTVFRTEN